MVTCESAADCENDEACTQGGHCVNVTGERDATAPLQADFDGLDDLHGLGVAYKLPDNAILNLHDLDGDGYALRIATPLLFDGAGSVFSVENDTHAILVEPTAGHSQLRDFRIDARISADENESVGIDIRAQGVRLDNILFWRLGTGVRAYSELDGEEVNLNNQQWSRLVFRSVRNFALDLRGEVNHGLMEGLEVLGSAGIYDASTMGNVYLGTSLHGAQDHSLTLDSSTSHHTVFGLYVEEGDPVPTSQSEFDFHVGGNAITRLIGPGERVGMQAAQLTFTNPGGGVEVRIPGGETSAIGWKHPDEGTWWHWRYFPNTSRWGIGFEDTPEAPFYWTGKDHMSGAGHFEYAD